MTILQGVIFIEVDINTRDITFLRTDTVNDYDKNTTNIYVQAIYRNSDGDKTYLSSEDIKNYVFTLYTLKPGTNNAFTINGAITTELKEQVYGGVIKFVMPKSCTNRAGVVKCELHVSKAEERIASTRFIFNVGKSLVTAFNEQLLDDEDFPVLQQLIVETQKVNYINDNNTSATTTYSSNKIENMINQKVDKTTANNIQQQVNNLVLGAVGDGNNAEVVQARGRHDVLNDRFLENEFNISVLNDVTDEYVNLFRYYDSGYYVNSTDGKLYANNLVGTTKFIDLTNVDTYIYTIVNTKKTHQMAFYDVTYEYVSGVRTETTGEWKLTIPDNAKYCKISFYLSDIDNFYIKGTSKLKKYIDSRTNSVSSDVDALRNDIFGFNKSGNVVDYNNSTNGGYYNGGFNGGTVGVWHNRTDVSQTEFINIEGINKIEIKIPSEGTNTIHQWVFKNSEGVIFAGGYRDRDLSSSDVIFSVEIPEGAVSISSAYVTEYPIEIYLYNNPISDRIDKLENKVSSKLKGKKLGIIGDSISTYNGYIPSGYAYFFPRGDVQSVENTWWKKLINETGMELCVNCAWSGSTISGDTDSTTNAYSGASEKRVNDLTNSNGDTPDIIIVYISINDFGKNNNVITGSSIGNESITQSGTISDISQAYVLLIKKLMTKYPNAKIYCTTIMCEQFASEMSGSYVNGYPNINPDDNVTLPTWNNMIRAIADNMGCGLIDMAKCGINYFNLSQYTIDKLHPNIAGHELMFKQALKDII